MIKETKNVCRVQIIDAKLIPFRSILISVKKFSVRMHHENKNIEENIFISVYIAENNLLTAWMIEERTLPIKTTCMVLVFMMALIGDIVLESPSHI